MRFAAYTTATRVCVAMKNGADTITWPDASAMGEQPVSDPR